MTSEQYSRRWADDVCKLIHRSSMHYQYWSMVLEMVEPMTSKQVYLRYRMTKGWIRQLIERAERDFLMPSIWVNIIIESDEFNDTSGAAPAAPD